MKQTITERVAAINVRFMRDMITREEALELLKPLADEYNQKAKEVAKKYPMFAKKPRLVKPEVTKSHGAKLR